MPFFSPGILQNWIFAFNHFYFHVPRFFRRLLHKYTVQQFAKTKSDPAAGRRPRVKTAHAKLVGGDDVSADEGAGTMRKRMINMRLLLNEVKY